MDDRSALVKYRLGMVTVVATCMSFAMMSHLSRKSFSSGSSQSTCFCQRDCMNSFARIVTGDRNPNGSKILGGLLKNFSFGD